MSSTGIFSVSKEDILEANENQNFRSIFFDNQQDFAQVLPHEVCDKIFLMLPHEDVMSCCKVSSIWRDIINNELHW
jgi:hypothetical protein